MPVGAGAAGAGAAGAGAAGAGAAGAGAAGAGAAGSSSLPQAAKTTDKIARMLSRKNTLVPLRTHTGNVLMSLSSCSDMLFAVRRYGHRRRLWSGHHDRGPFDHYRLNHPGDRTVAPAGDREQQPAVHNRTPRLHLWLVGAYQRFILLSIHRLAETPLRLGIARHPLPNRHLIAQRVRSRESNACCFSTARVPKRPVTELVPVTTERVFSYRASSTASL